MLGAFWVHSAAQRDIIFLISGPNSEKHPNNISYFIPYLTEIEYSWIQYLDDREHYGYAYLNFFKSV